MNTVHYAGMFRVGEWQVDRAACALHGAAGEQRLEPKVMDLLCLLAGAPGTVLSRDQIMAALWPGLVVGDDALARTVSKLRQALGDDARLPRYIETISKRGYRLLAEVGPAETTPDGPDDGDAAQAAATAATIAATKVDMPPARRWRWPALSAVALLVAAAAIVSVASRDEAVRRAPGAQTVAADEPARLLARADDAYFQFSRADNEAAIELYQRVLGLHPDDVPALAGLANALAQRCIRWPDTGDGVAVEFTRLRDALDNGHLQRSPAREQLQRARQLAERAVALAPTSAPAHKALGFVAGAQGEFDFALASYRRAVALDRDAWGALINIGDVLEITGRGDEALPYLERAHAAMAREYDRNPAQIRPWHARLGVGIAERYRDAGNAATAEAWYRKVLTQSPLHPEATRGLAMLLRAGGDAAEADRLCAELTQRLGAAQSCSPPAP